MFLSNLLQTGAQSTCGKWKPMGTGCRGPGMPESSSQEGSRAPPSAETSKDVRGTECSAVNTRNASTRTRKRRERRRKEKEKLIKTEHTKFIQNGNHAHARCRYSAATAAGQYRTFFDIIHTVPRQFDQQSVSLNFISSLCGSLDTRHPHQESDAMALAQQAAVTLPRPRCWTHTTIQQPHAWDCAFDRFQTEQRF